MQPAIPEEQQPDDMVYQFAAPMWGVRSGRTACFAARMSGLYLTDNGGKTWKSAYQSLKLTEPLPTLSVAVLPDLGDELTVLAGVNGGLLRSSDGGQSWEHIDVAVPAPAVISLAVSPNYMRDRLLFAGTFADGVHYSSDRGVHWRTGNLALIDMNVLCLAISPDFETDAAIFAGTQSGLFGSRNAGRSWREVDLPIGYEAVNSLALSPHFAKDGTLFAGTEKCGLLFSLDWGAHWRRLGQPDLSKAINQIVLAKRFPREPRLLVLQEGELFISEDRGLSWVDWPEPRLDHAAATAILAPRGLGAGAPVWVGLEGGGVVRLRL